MANAFLIPQFKSFEKVWGTATTEADYPSRKVTEKQKADKESKRLFRSKYVVHFVRCSIPNCKKPRVVYKATPLTDEQKDSLLDSLDHFMFTCGGPVTTTTDLLNGRVVTRISLQCSDPVEFEYYSRKARFPLCCSTCGMSASSEEPLNSA